MMRYPTHEQITTASAEQLVRWWRFLPSPGMAAIGQPDFEAVLENESMLVTLVGERLTALGGITPALSKKVGWVE